jgi:hypothetical protein
MNSSWVKSGENATTESELNLVLCEEIFLLIQGSELQFANLEPSLRVVHRSRSFHQSFIFIKHSLIVVLFQVTP